MKTKVVGKVVRRQMNEEGQLEVTIAVDNPMYEMYLRGLNKEKDFAITFSDIVKGRSLQQNKLLWVLIGKIIENPNAQTQDSFDMYCYLLRVSKAKYTYLSVLEEGLEDFKMAHGIRAVSVVGNETRENGRRFVNCLCFLGSSQMSTKEMNVLIDTTLDYAHHLGIDTRADEEEYGWQ